MHRLHAAFLAALAAAAQPAEPTAFDVRSENGRFVAHVRPIEIPNSERDRPRFELTVLADRDDGVLREQWSGPYEPRSERTRHVLTDDGTTFVRIVEDPRSARPLVEVIVKGRPLAAWSAAELGVESSSDQDATTWLATDTRAVRLRPGGDLDANASLDLLGRDGRVRTIDLVVGTLRAGHDASAFELAALPLPPDEYREHRPKALACVESFSAPDTVEGGAPCRVLVRGKFPAPGWVLVGFDVRSESDRELVLTPCILPPPPKTIAMQPVVGFESVAEIIGLHAGRYALRVDTCDGGAELASRSIEVLPPDLLVTLREHGGIAGGERSVALFWDAHAEVLGDAGTTRRVFLVEPEAVVEVARLLSGAKPDAAPKPASAGADLITYELAWIVHESASGPATVRRIRRDDVSLDAPLRAIVERLHALASRAEQRRYVVDVHASRIAVRTESTGLLGALGHDHELMVRELSGEVWAAPAELEHARVHVAVGAASLAVVSDENQPDRTEIESTLNAKVLESTRHPRITFRSTAVVDRSGAVASGVGRRDVTLALRGDLVLHGVSRSIEVPVRVEIDGESLRVLGDFVLRQSDYRIRPTSAAAGTVKVADKVRIVLDIVARAE